VIEAMLVAAAESSKPWQPADFSCFVSIHDLWGVPADCNFVPGTGAARISWPLKRAII
jgi:hypothetical protein